MKIHKEGKKILRNEVIIIILLGIINSFSSNFLLILLPICLSIFGLTLYFFRIPNRKFDKKEGVIYAPCDGKIVVIEETIEQEFYKNKRIQVSIFMSPLNIHNQLYPIKGQIKYTQYKAGKFLFAWEPKASTDNESCSVVIENKEISILCKQIAGALARRIITYAKINDIVDSCEELGFIKFGSRVDLFLPLGTKITTQLGRKVTGGQSIIGTY
tara:strand:+ start:502 stop:1143 length:642 start_codon:yes stop_codon:yes gene_type:complete